MAGTAAQGSTECPSGPAPANGPAPATGGGTECATDGSDYTYVETLSGTTRTVVTNHCPNHVYQNHNPNYPIAGDTTYTMPASVRWRPLTHVDVYCMVPTPAYLRSLSSSLPCFPFRRVRELHVG